VIRVLLASHSSELENAIRSSSTLELAGRLDPAQLPLSELAGDVLLLDVDDLHDFDWRALAESPIPIVLLVGATDPALIGSALRSGIRGAVPRDATPQEIDAAVHAVFAGLVVTAPEYLPETPASSDDLLEPLSAREREVLDLVAEGLSNKLIAHQLNISEHTVKTHVASIFAKLGASSRTEAVSQAIRRGLVML
jgi:NarL family two-component system response regulator YdfI